MTTDNFITYDPADRRYETNGRTLGNVRSELQWSVITALGTTDYTRFGAWRRESTTDASRKKHPLLRQANSMFGPEGRY